MVGSDIVRALDVIARLVSHARLNCHRRNLRREDHAVLTTATWGSKRNTSVLSSIYSSKPTSLAHSQCMWSRVFITAKTSFSEQLSLAVTCQNVRTRTQVASSASACTTDMGTWVRVSVKSRSCVSVYIHSCCIASLCVSVTWLANVFSGGDKRVLFVFTPVVRMQMNSACRALCKLYEIGQWGHHLRVVEERLLAPLNRAEKLLQVRSSGRKPHGQDGI